MADEPSAAYDAVADSYSRALDPDGTGLRDPVLAALIGLPAGKAVLSVACGQGQDARLLADLGARVTGVDVSEGMLSHARRHEASRPRGITYVHGDAQDLAAFAEASFDGAVCHMALMDIPRLGATLRSIARVLRADGWFVCSIVHPCFQGHVDIVSDYLVDHRYAKRVPWDWLPTHAYHRPLSAYVNELASGGFRITRMVEAHHDRSSEGVVPGLLYLRAVKTAA